MCKIIPFIFSILLVSLIPLKTNALQMKFTLGEDIVSHQDSLHISYDLYYPTSSASQQMKGINQHAFSLWLEAFNRENKDFTPIDFEGKSSQISLGYSRNGQDNYPASCQHLRLSEVHTINIVQTETGCTVKAVR